MKERKEAHATKQNQYIDLDNRMLDLIQQSNHIMKCK